MVTRKSSGLKLGVRRLNSRPHPLLPRQTFLSTVFLQLNKNGSAFTRWLEACLLKALVSMGEIDVAQKAYVGHRTKQPLGDFGETRGAHTLATPILGHIYPLQICGFIGQRYYVGLEDQLFAVHDDVNAALFDAAKYPLQKALAITNARERTRRMLSL